MQYDDKTSALELLEYIDPALLNYEEWLNIGMALKASGATASDWDIWSKRDSGRHEPGLCFKKWDTFRGSSNPITLGTIVNLAKEQGWTPPERNDYDGEGHELEWDAEIGPTKEEKDELKIIDRHWLQDKEVNEPKNWNPKQDLIKFLSAVFNSDEHVCYVTESYFNEKANKHLPKNAGVSDRNAGQLIEELQKTDDITNVIGSWQKEAGGWVRINPMDGKGGRDENVTAYRYALIECDHVAIAKQNAIYREMELPIATLVHSGGKSLHALVHIDAEDYQEYRKRVDYLYDVLKRNGLKMDTQNRNPSRLSRLPGITRGDKKQFLVDTNIGKESWSEWREWIEDINDDLPDAENYAESAMNMPDLEPELISGVLRQGHKMLIAGPSKAGKSFDMIQLSIALAEGRKWHGFQCQQGKVLYVNLELSRPSCINRFNDVYNALGLEQNNSKNIDIWHLRGKSLPMDKLAPKLIRRALKKRYIAVILDPIYKVITGDENSADQMSQFCNQFDKVCTELNTSVIYAHHHSKGAQGQKKSADRASGSGVFARDPDALLDYIELELDEARRKQLTNRIVCEAIGHYLDSIGVNDWRNQISQDDQIVMDHFRDEAHKLVDDKPRLSNAVYEARQKAKHMSGWRIEGTLREFATFDPVKCFFSWPIHKQDTDDLLKDAKAAGEEPPWQTGRKTKQEAAEDRKQTRMTAIESAYGACDMGDPVTIVDISEFIGKSEKQIRRHINEHPDFVIKKGIVFKKGQTDKNKNVPCPDKEGQS